MSFTAAAASGEYQPAVGILGIGYSGGHCPSEQFLILWVAAAASSYQIVEGEVDQWPKIAVALETGQALAIRLFLLALAWNHFPEIRMAIGHVIGKPASAPAEGAL